MKKFARLLTVVFVVTAALCRVGQGAEETKKPAATPETRKPELSPEKGIPPSEKPIDELPLGSQRAEPAAAWAPSLRIGGFGTWHADRDFQDGHPGGFSYYEVGGYLAKNIQLRKDMSLMPTLAFTHMTWRWYGNQDFVPGVKNPWNEVYSVVGGLTYKADLSRYFTLKLSGILGSSAEKAMGGGSLFGSAGASLIWRPVRKFGIGAGAAYVGGFGAYRWAPNLFLDWRITEKLRLQTAGIGLRLGYDINKRLNVGVSGRYQYRVWRLRQNGPVPDGYGLIRGFDLGASVRYRLLRNLVVSLTLGGTPAHELKVYNKNNDRLNSRDAKPGFYSGIGVLAVF